MLDLKITSRILNQCHSVWSIPSSNVLHLIWLRKYLLHIVAVAHNDPGDGQKSDSIDALQRVRPYSIRAEDPQCVSVGWESLDNLDKKKIVFGSSHFFLGENLDEFFWLEVQVKDVEENITNSPDRH